MKIAAGIATAIAMIGLPQPALAAVDCSGTVFGKAVSDDGSILIRGTWRGDYTKICNIKTDWNGITPDVCALWTAMADAAVTTGKSLYVQYATETSCATIPTWGQGPAPYRITLFG